MGEENSRRKKENRRETSVRVANALEEIVAMLFWERTLGEMSREEEGGKGCRQVDEYETA